MLLIVLSDQLPVKSLGGPLPHQLADRTRGHLEVIGLAVPIFNPATMRSRDHIEYYLRFHGAVFDFEANSSRVTNPFAANPCGFARLACLIHAASVHSEPGPNSPKKLGLKVTIRRSIKDNKISKNKDILLLKGYKDNR